MRTYIFTDRERRILEAYLTWAKINRSELSKILTQIHKKEMLFEDVYLYLQVRSKIAPVEG